MTKAKTTLILMFLLVISVIAFYYQNHNRLMNERHHLLCEILKPGMSKDEVLHELEQEGNITVIDGNWSEKFVGVIDISFIDSQNRNLRFSSQLVFRDNEYEGAYRLIRSDNVEPICNFYQPTQSITEAPRQ
jgi:hypothetical protein